MILIYPVGIPVFFFSMLWKYRRFDRLYEPGVRAQLGILYDAFDSRFITFALLCIAVSHGM